MQRLRNGSINVISVVLIVLLVEKIGCFTVSSPWFRLSTRTTTNQINSVYKQHVLHAEEPKNNNEENTGTAFENVRSTKSMQILQSKSSMRIDEGEDGFDAHRAKRQAIINEALKRQDAELFEKRKKQKWGKFANVTSKTSIQEILQEEKKLLDQENKEKAQVAKQAGVTFEVLESMDAPKKKKEISVLSKKRNGYFSNMDENIEKQWEQISGGDEDTRVVNGEVVSKDRLRGIRVGSAGGWSLEVFPGDFVVHRKYGIGRFEKTCIRPKTRLTDEEIRAQAKRRREILDEAKESGVSHGEMFDVRQRFGTIEDDDPISTPKTTCLEIKYFDGIVHVPVDKAYRLSRYRAGDSPVKPKLTKVLGKQWEATKKKVKEKLRRTAEDVLALYVTRETLYRQPFDPIKETNVQEFEETFPFEPTPDQKKCFEDVENDMVWRMRPMDRLVCGDVGFGKTEVALRAIFRTISNGKQAAFLAPTGVLSAQHFKNVLKRMGPDSSFGKRICLLRGGMARSTKAGRELREAIEAGDFDVIVGTHALLSKDLKFKDLGLLVIDEEQRFGVKQKERLKLICDKVDVLTMTATPIPRTLQMSASGIRDTSIIRSPPPMRKAVKTAVVTLSNETMHYAIETEMKRGGQCFFVVPRIKMIEEVNATLYELFNNKINITVAHGRMERGKAEENVASFAEGKYNLLLATTVIENGVDIPTVNTILVYDAGYFGMSTLYQLRGRVGRSDQQAYAYFLVNDDRDMSPEAVFRLDAIGEFQELGAGFDVANRDLEIRGAGSLLGTEQSGDAEKVGFDLYMRMLKKSIKDLRGLDLSMVPRTNVLLPNHEGTIELSSASKDRGFTIPVELISDETERKQQEAFARLAESTTRLVELTNSWKETYGPLPASLQQKLKTLHLHACTRRLGIDLVSLVDRGNGRVDCILRSPGLRRRHWAEVCQSLPNGAPPSDLDVWFPPRFSSTGKDQEVKGGADFDLNKLLEGYDRDNDDWDSFDDDDEAAADVSSAFADVKDIDGYPRFEIKNFGLVPEGKRVEALLKTLLPPARIVFAKQEQDKKNAKIASELRQKQEVMAKRKKVEEQKLNEFFQM